MINQRKIQPTLDTALKVNIPLPCIRGGLEEGIQKDLLQITPLHARRPDD